MNQFIRLNIALVPEKELSGLSIQLSKKIAQDFDVYFTLDNSNFYPHITLYSVEYPQKNLERVKLRVEQITRQMSAFPIALKTFTSSRGYKDIEFENNSSLSQLHEWVITALNPLREGRVREKYQNKNERVSLSNIEVKNISEFGSPAVLSQFRPHLTITRVKDEVTANEVVAKLQCNLTSSMTKKQSQYLRRVIMGLAENCLKSLNY